MSSDFIKTCKYLKNKFISNTELCDKGDSCTICLLAELISRIETGNSIIIHELRSINISLNKWRMKFNIT